MVIANIETACEGQLKWSRDEWGSTYWMRMWRKFLAQEGTIVRNPIYQSISYVEWLLFYILMTKFPPLFLLLGEEYMFLHYV